jgi:hypothetical protein
MLSLTQLVQVMQNLADYPALEVTRAAVTSMTAIALAVCDAAKVRTSRSRLSLSRHLLSPSLSLLLSLPLPNQPLPLQLLLLTVAVLLPMLYPCCRWLAAHCAGC